MRLPATRITSALLWIVATRFVTARTAHHRYQKGEYIELWVDKIGPYANPQEAYEYYTLPYCAPKTKFHPEKDDGRFNALAWQSIGEYLSGHARRHSGHNVVFGTNKTESCITDPLTEKQAKQFADAIHNRWFYQMHIDDLPVWGMVGELLQSKEDAHGLVPYVYTTRNLVIGYNGDQIVKVDLLSDPRTLHEVKTGVKLQFKLRIDWEPTTEEFVSRLDRYYDNEFFAGRDHRFEVLNSYLIFLFVMGLVALSLKCKLKRDYQRYSMNEMEEEESGSIELGSVHDSDRALLCNESSGWRQVHGDVFRAPVFLPLFAALIGTGWQLVVSAVAVILFALPGFLRNEVDEECGKALDNIIVSYSLSSVIGGYTSGKYFKQSYATTAQPNEDEMRLWQVVMALTVLFLPTVTSLFLSILNFVSLSYGTINTIPFTVIGKLFMIWVFVSVPLCVTGTMMGRQRVTSQDKDHFPCRVNAIPRPIPDAISSYGKPASLIPLAGLLLFGSIYIELNKVFSSLWNYKYYHIYGFLLGFPFILAIVVGMTSIIVVYFCLNAENYYWQWTAFGSGASIAVYIFAYGIYYFLFKTQMHGLLQVTFYFGYMTLIALYLGILCGAIGHGTASRFVRGIFRNIKVD